MLVDQLGRPLRDLRISVTDRCNLRCTYCMPASVFGPDYAFVPRSELLSFEEIERLTRLFLILGVRKLRLTGGEPTLRRDLSDLIARLARLEGVEDLAMTTNGLLLPRLARELKSAGLRRVTVSLDSLDPDVFGQMNGLGVHPQQVLDGIEAALQAGLGVKINTVVQRGVNDQGLRELWLALRAQAPVRFIEFMDVGNHNGWNMDSVVPSSEVLARLSEGSETSVFDSLSPDYRGEVAARHRDAQGHEVGLISSVTAPFCGDCSRARLSAVGALYTCLFASAGTDLRAPLRAGATDEQLMGLLTGVWSGRSDRYSEERGEQTRQSKVEMSYIGG
ncbi:GTP 3',8-cyclase MoaA [Deinococcus deserti]|uniref:GTP 3',8-cyclase n=1 Tax=Deinococcus deserti (strain DSM 17065 / CIP 109153 / LMG 22923 / VCD115) TaxID=546414 RepID=C1D0R0_DEIDV|nr:GTP 3',8-cyclase MoaA [Deinococcus deserti]ACO45434.2 putative molybdenum cofactor biosynthesis protein A [Deinococcus deserti VCD115]